ncbi:structural cement protein Gp24 [Leptospira kirschneri]
MGYATTPKLYSSESLGLGQQPNTYPGQFVNGLNLATGDRIPFGRATGENVDPSSRIRTCLLSAANLSRIFAGVSVYSTDAKDPENSAYLSGDVFGRLEIGYVNVYTEESAGPSDAVRFRIVNDPSNPLKIRGNFCKTAIPGQTALLSGARFDSVSSDDGIISLFLSDFTTVALD